MQAISAIYKRLQKDYKERLPYAIAENNQYEFERDKCLIFEFEIDEELFPFIKKMFDEDGFNCEEAVRTGKHCDAIDWLMRISVEPRDHSNPLPASWLS